MPFAVQSDRMRRAPPWFGSVFRDRSLVCEKLAIARRAQ
jgi:hypothetical protein